MNVMRQWLPQSRLTTLQTSLIARRWVGPRLNDGSGIKLSVWSEPRHDKTNKVSVRPAKTQISLGIRPDWSESSLFAGRKLESLATNWAHSEDSDLTGRMPRLICRHWAHSHFVGFVMSLGNSTVGLLLLQRFRVGLLLSTRLVSSQWWILIYMFAVSIHWWVEVLHADRTTSMCIWTTTDPRVRLLERKPGSSPSPPPPPPHPPPVIYYRPFRGDASAVVYSNCQCSIWTIPSLLIGWVHFQS